MLHLWQGLALPSGHQAPPFPTPAEPNQGLNMLRDLLFRSHQLQLV
jgi:hypothetical protein